ncbi:MAG: hypothetical protein U0892_01755 [Pirellulales bacterium]
MRHLPHAGKQCEFTCRRTQVDSIVTPDYLAIELKDLDRLLAAEAERRKQTTEEAGGIDQAVTVVKLDGQTLKSQTSAWTITWPKNGSLSFSQPSFAIEDQTPADRTAFALTKHARFSRDGKLLLTAPDETTKTLWFGLSARCKSFFARIFCH